MHRHWLLMSHIHCLLKLFPSLYKMSELHVEMWWALPCTSSMEAIYTFVVFFLLWITTVIVIDHLYHAAWCVMQYNKLQRKSVGICILLGHVWHPHSPQYSNTFLTVRYSPIGSAAHRLETNTFMFFMDNSEKGSPLAHVLSNLEWSSIVWVSIKLRNLLATTLK